MTNTDKKKVRKTSAFTVMVVGSKPVISTITPNFGLSSQNTGVVITGSNFRSGAVVQMIKSPTEKAAIISSSTTTKISCTLPTKGATAGLWSIKILNADGTSVTKQGGFTIKTATTTIKETVPGLTRGVVMNSPVFAYSSDPPSQGPSESGGGIIPVIAPIVRPGGVLSQP